MNRIDTRTEIPTLTPLEVKGAATFMVDSSLRGEILETLLFEPKEGVATSDYLDINPSMAGFSTTVTQDGPYMRVNCQWHQTI